MTGSSRPSLGLVALAALGAWACTPEAPSGLASRNLIVMIADGAGVEHWTLAYFARSELAVREFPVIGTPGARSSSGRCSPSTTRCDWRSTSAAGALPVP